MATVLPPHPDMADPDDWVHDAVHVNGVVIHYVEIGRGPETATGTDTGDAADDRPLVLLLHGFPGFWYDWRKQLDPLADAGYRVVAPDLRGYNRSEKPRGVSAYRMDELVGDVVGLIEALGHDSAILVGRDWGGGVAWELAIRRPRLVDRLAVCNAPHPGAYRRTLLRSPQQIRRSAYLAFFQIPWLPERVLAANDYERIMDGLRKLSTTDAFSDRDLRRYRNAIARRGALTAALNYYRAALRTEGPRWLRRLLPRGGRSETVEVPTLVVWGEQDPALVPSLAEASAAQAVGGRVERVPDAGHWVQLDAADRVNATLREFFRGEGEAAVGADRRPGAIGREPREPTPGEPTG